MRYLVREFLHIHHHIDIDINVCVCIYIYIYIYIYYFLFFLQKCQITLMSVAFFSPRKRTKERKGNYLTKYF